MGKPTGFMEFDRQIAARRPVSERVKDWREVYLPFPAEDLNKQAARCMDCGAVLPYRLPARQHHP